MAAVAAATGPPPTANDDSDSNSVWCDSDGNKDDGGRNNATKGVAGMLLFPVLLAPIVSASCRVFPTVAAAVVAVAAEVAVRDDG